MGESQAQKSTKVLDQPEHVAEISDTIDSDSVEGVGVGRVPRQRRKFGCLFSRGAWVERRDTDGYGEGGDVVEIMGDAWSYRGNVSEMMGDARSWS